ncbi:MAG: hypothetical protein ACRDG3_00245 [Tepidiformaceae bacterium]
MLEGMVTHVAYIELHPSNAHECLETIREQLELGWQLCQVRGPRTGPFAVLFRMDDAAAA